jgi:hypothetical protein
MVVIHLAGDFRRRRDFTDSSFHTINTLRIKSVMKLLFLQQQNPRAEQVIMG